MPRQFISGWKKDPRDERDYLVKTKRPEELPDKVDLSEYLPDVRDQGRLGSCVGFGVSGILTGIAKQQACYSEWFSPTWVYNGARLAIGKLDEDYGCYPRDAMEFIKTYGCLLEHFRPYVDVLDTTDPTAWECAPEALKWPILKYERCVDGVDGICSALAAGHLVAVGVPWSFGWLDCGPDGVLPEDYKTTAGGHEVFLHGYDKNFKAPVWYCTGGLYGQNSWGTGWGKGGRFVMPWTAPNNWKLWGGYDAHIVYVEWSSTPPPPPPPDEHQRWLRLLAGYSNDGKKTWKDIHLDIPLP